MRVPDAAEAEALLREGERRNPGRWVAHSRVAGRVARAIASQHPALDPDAAYAMGLLHDIGRTLGGPTRPEVLHITDGYQLMTERGFDDCAGVCLSHSFPIHDADAYAGNWDGAASEKIFVQQFLATAEYTTYDKLVQVCDALSLPEGPVVMEKRLVDVVIRHGFNACTLPKWQAFLNLLAELDADVGGSVYALLPDVVSSTFPTTGHHTDR